MIPGLGGQQAMNRAFAIAKHWKDRQTTVSMFDPEWHTDEPLDQKFQRLLTFFDEISSEVDVFIVAYSAGGPLAISLFAERKTIKRCILISCKLVGSQTIGPVFQRRAPALLPAVQASERILDTLTTDEAARCICMRPFLDEVVPIKDMLFKGAKRARIPSILHAPSIALALLFFVKRKLKV